MRHQREQLRRLFLNRPSQWIPLPEIMQFAAQYNARLFELRHREGMVIENKTAVMNGVRHSWFRYLPEKIEEGISI